MGRNGLRKRNNRLTDDHETEPPKSSKKASVTKDLPTQHMEEVIYSGNMNMTRELEFSFHYGGHFIFSSSRKYVSGQLVKTNIDIDFITFFDLLDEMKKLCNFNILEGDKFAYLRGDRIISDRDGLVECLDDSYVKNMLLSYEKHKDKSTDIYTLRKNDIFMSSFLRKNSSNENLSEQVSETVVEEHESTNSTGPNILKRKTIGPTRCVNIINLQEGQKLAVQFDEDDQAIGENATDFTWFLGQTVRSRTCCPLKVNGWKEIEQDKIDHMWDIILEKFNFDVSEGRKGAILGHMSDLYRDYRHKLKNKYFDSKATYALRLRNKPKLLTTDEWKYLVNLWSGDDFQKKSTQNKANRSKRSLPPYSGTKSYARLRYEMEKKSGKPPSRVEVFLESRKRKKGKQVDAFQQDIIVQFDQLKEQQKEGEISLNDDDIFEKVLGVEKNGYLRAYGPGKNITEYFGGRPTKIQLIKQVEMARKEANERVEEVKREAKKQVEEVKREADEKVEGIKKETDNKLVEMEKRWEKRFQMMLAAQNRQSNDANQIVVE